MNLISLSEKEFEMTSEPVSDLALFMPHRPPMVWIDEVIWSRATDNGIEGECLVRLNPKQLFFDEDGLLRASTMIEWVAQAYGFAKARVVKASGLGFRAKKAFLVGVNRFSIDARSIKADPNQEVIIWVKTLKNLYPLAVIEGRVKLSSGPEIAHGQIKVYSDERENSL